MRTLFTVLFAISTACAAWGQSGEVGFLRFAFGELLLNGESLTGTSVGTMILEPGQKFETGNGFAEVSIGADNYLRVSRQSGFEIPSTDPEDVQIQHLSGSLVVELLDKDGGEKISVLTPEATVTLAKRGLYRLDMTAEGEVTLSVFRGQAIVSAGGADHKVKSKQRFALADATANAEKFRPADGDDFDQWCAERSIEIKKERSLRLRNSGDLLRDIPMRTW